VEIREAVLVSQGPKGPKASAVGVRMGQDGSWSVHLYAGTVVAANLRHLPKASVNWVDQAWPLVAAALGCSEELPLVLDEEGFWFLASAVAMVPVQVVQRKSGDPEEVLLQPGRRRELRAFAGYNRAFGGLVEAAIAATRLTWLGAAAVWDTYHRAAQLVEKTGAGEDVLALTTIRRFLEAATGRESE